MPEIRAAQLKEDLLALSELGSELASRVLADLAPATLRRIVLATRVDWLPAELNVELAHVGERVLGEDGLRTWGRASVLRSMGTSLLQPILEGAVRLFGLSPPAIFRTVPSAYRAAYRNCGEMVVTGGEPDARIVTLQGLPAPLQDHAFLVAIEGALEGVFDTCRVEGAVRLVSPIGERVEFRASWRPR
ncbi:MAG TPA: hypothetical protein VML50_13965 [Anaeromyxobacter sp.]|nr:hypothetical protein [Anaeromyxobacter sp.]